MQSEAENMISSFSSIIPTYNEEESIGHTVEKIVSFFETRRWIYEVIIVDSNSTDRTPEIVDVLAKKYKSVRVVHQKLRKGFGNGLREGFNASQYDLVWYMDADYPYDVSEVLPKALCFVSGYDAVAGYRVGKKESKLRAFYSRSYDFLLWLLMGLKIRNCNFSFKLIKRDVLKQLDLRSDGWFIDTELLLELKKKGFKLTQIPAPFFSRTKGDSKVKILPTVSNLLYELFAYVRR